MLLVTQAVLMLHAIHRNSPTIDEPYHLAAGLRYWDTAEFWCYHHNPPLTRLVATLPLILLDVPRVHGDYEFQLHNRNVDELVCEDFSRLHRHDFSAWLNVARTANLSFVLLGGWIVFRWSRELSGDCGGLISLSLWVGSPWILGHGMLLTPDVGAAALMITASYAFWYYLRAPGFRWALHSGWLLGLAQAAKFTAVLLVPVWLLAAGMRFFPRRGTAPRPSGTGDSPDRTRTVAEAAVLVVVSLLTLNAVYLFEGTGARLGGYDFRSSLLSPNSDDDPLAPNAQHRFRWTWWERIPTPLPRHYLFGFDDQLWELEQRPFCKYLRGELRTPQQPGWWYYYLYGAFVKTPEASLLLLVGSLLMLGVRPRACDCHSLIILLGSAVLIFVSLSLRPNLNSHVRYIIPAIPFLCILAGRVGRWAEEGHVLRRSLVVASLAVALVSGVSAHPHHLAYFNLAAGGPDRGVSHLSDSNLDWGQGLFALRDWLRENAPDSEIQLAYIGALNPEDVGIVYQQLNPDTPRPGIHAVSATLVSGIPWYVHAPHACRDFCIANEFARYRRLTPIARPGHAIYIYDVDEAGRKELTSASDRQLQKPDR